MQFVSFQAPWVFPVSSSSLASLSMLTSICRHKERVSAPDELRKIYILSSLLRHFEHVPHQTSDAI